MDNNFNLSPYEQKYVNIINKLKETFFKKNHDYGSSVKKNFDKFESYGKNEGLKYVFGRIAEKHDRLENLIYGNHPNQVTDEPIEDTLLDMANYAILAAVSIQEHKTTNEPKSLRRLVDEFTPVEKKHEPKNMADNMTMEDKEPYKRTNIQRILNELDKPYYGG